MSSLADRPELIGFFSYSREDDEDSKGALSALRDRIQRELRGQLGRSARDFRLWQDREAIAPGKLWESELKAAVAQSVFFIPIVTPTSVRSTFCRFEFEAFLAREQALGRDDLIFPLLYIRVPALENAALRAAEPVLTMIARRQYVDWREFRHRDVYSTQVGEAIERLCSKIAEALDRPDPSEAENQRRRQEAEQQRQSEAEKQRQEEERRRAQEEAEQQRRREAERQRREEEQRRQQERPPSKTPATVGAGSAPSAPSQAQASGYAAAQAAFDRGDYETAASQARAVGAAGDARAQFLLGLLYETGRGIAQDDAVAVQWYRKAADQGDVAGQSNLGFMYETGRGVAQDYSLAVQWYRKAADQGNAYAQASLVRLGK